MESSLSTTELSKSELFQKLRNQWNRWVSPALCVFSDVKEPQYHGGLPACLKSKPSGKETSWGGGGGGAANRWGMLATAKLTIDTKKDSQNQRGISSLQASHIRPCAAFPWYFSAHGIAYVKSENSKICSFSTNGVALFLGSY